MAGSCWESAEIIRRYDFKPFHKNLRFDTQIVDVKLFTGYAACVIKVTSDGTSFRYANQYVFTSLRVGCIPPVFFEVILEGLDKFVACIEPKTTGELIQLPIFQGQV